MKSPLIVVRLQPTYGPSHPGVPYYKVAIDVPGDTLLSVTEYVKRADGEAAVNMIEGLIS